jgi:hypothetical protein
MRQLVTATTLALALGAVAVTTAACNSDSQGQDAAPPGDSVPGSDWTTDLLVKEDAFTDDPETCAGAAWAHTYVGCDFWPTVLPNTVGVHFDYAVVVSNAGAFEAKITIERGGKLVESGDVQPGELRTFYLPWVDGLKHWLGLCDTDATAPFQPDFVSRHVADGAYHLTSTVPVTVYQFNPLEYGPQGGPAGKDWSACESCLFGCHSYTNDASLLLPSTAATGTYRITAPAGQDTEDVKQPGYIAVTGFEDGTKVKLKVGPSGEVTAGGSILGVTAGQTVIFTVNKGEVALLVGTKTTDLAGSLLSADKPVQVMSGAPCHYMPDDYGPCDHLEESVFPAETLGKRYVVTVPTNARGVPIGHVVRIIGNVDNTKLTYPAVSPANAPAMIHAGEVHDLGIVKQNFEVVGDNAFAVTSYMLGSSLSDPGHLLDSAGDPAQTNVQTVEQYRTKYIFLAPTDYTVSYADIVTPPSAKITIDGKPVTESFSAISSEYGVRRVVLDPGKGGAHVLVSDQPVGLQVMGFGFATSYYYPGGLNLKLIAPPPQID